MPPQSLPSIARNLTICLVSVIVVLSLAFLSVYHYQLLKGDQARLQNTADDYINSMISTLEIPLWNLDRENIKRVCDFYFKTQWVTQVTLTGISGERMYHEILPSPVHDTLHRSGKIIHNDEVIGTVDMVLNPLPSHQTRMEFLKATAVTLLIAIIGVALFTGFFLKKFLKHPMGNISVMAHAYAKGNYHPELTGTIYKEFIPLVAALEEMGHKIESQIKTLQKTDRQLTRHKDHLEEMVALRTRELEASNQKLQRAEKMEAIGTLAGGVAHDLNNILSGLVSYPELILMDLPLDSPLYGPLSTIQKSGEKAARIVQDLLTMARRGVAVTEVVNLNQIITEQLDSPEMHHLKSFYPYLDLKTVLAPDLLNVMGSPTHLAKSIMNLICNGAEAMSQGGTVTILTDNVYLDMPVKGYEKVAKGEYITVRVSDTGIGLSDTDRIKIFEPFYTKKKMGRSGSGLGMAVVWGTIKDHNGYIDIKSTRNKGTTFTLYLPVTREKTPSDQPVPAMAALRGKGQTILIIDDVATQRKIAGDILKRLGYRVTVADSGEAACHYLAHNTADLIVLDMIMEPGMDGLDTYKQILKIHPGQKALIASGYSRTDRVRELQKLGAGQYLKKPYTLAKLGTAVKKALCRPLNDLQKQLFAIK